MSLIFMGCRQFTALNSVQKYQRGMNMSSYILYRSFGNNNSCYSEHVHNLIENIETCKSIEKYTCYIIKYTQPNSKIARYVIQCIPAFTAQCANVENVYTRIPRVFKIALKLYR